MKRHLWIVAVIIAALASGWWLGRGTAPVRSATTAEKATADAGKPDATARSNTPKRTTANAQSSMPTNTASASQPLPPPGTPLKQTFDELKARADAGDATAASRLYRDLQRCEVARSAEKTIADLTQQPRDSANEMNIASLIEHKRSIVGNRAQLCNGLTSAQLEWRIPGMLRAAQLGDLDASDCYLSPGGLIESPELSSHPDWLSDFRENALPLADQAIERGDWIMVMQVADSYLHGHDDPVYGEPVSELWQATGQDDAMAYRYFKLAMLGVPDNDSGRGFKDTIELLGEKLSASKRTTADEWARQTFLSHFHLRPDNDAYQSFPVCSTD